MKVVLFLSNFAILTRQRQSGGTEFTKTVTCVRFEDFLNKVYQQGFDSFLSFYRLQDVGNAYLA